MSRLAKSPLLGLMLLAIVAPLAAQVDLGSEAQRENGKALYGKYCSQCHGDAGDGQGYATHRVKPQPRDFTSGKYKFRSTPNGRLPTDADVVKVIREGLPYTSMPGWPGFSDQEVRNLVYYLKTFSSDFENPEMYGEPITVGSPPESTEESIIRGRQLYEEQGCAACHGEQGRGNGLSAPTLEDDWGHHVRPADLTQPWTWRGGSSKEVVYKTFSTGLNGTPMPAYADVLEPEDRWHLVNYIYSLSPSRDPAYLNLLVTQRLDDELDLDRAEELFAEAPAVRFPLIGQITEPGRNFYPSATSVLVQAVYNRKEIAFRLRWNDLKAETSGHNDPTIEVPTWDEDNPVAGASESGGGGFFGDEEDSGGFFGAAEEPAGGSDAGFFGDAEETASDDFFGGGDDDFFGGGGSAASGAGGSDWSDAVAIQLPASLPTGNKKPYFLFGDSTSPVDLWHLDLGTGRMTQYLARGSDSLEVVEADDFRTSSSYDDGQWTVIFKRALRAEGGVSFTSDQYVPVAFSVWDGFNRERGNKRALSSWMYLYNEPAEKISPVGPMIKAAAIALLIELLVIFYIRQRRRAAAPEKTPGGLRGGAVAT